MTNKQVKILENKLAAIDREIQEIVDREKKRLEWLSLNDGLYQNLQGQLLEKRNRLNDMSEFIQMMEKKNR